MINCVSQRVCAGWTWPLLLSTGKRTLTSGIDHAFTVHRVVPDVIAAAPASLVQVSYGAHVVKLGNVLTPTQVRAQPSLVKWDALPNVLYTLCMTGMEFPRPARACMPNTHGTDPDAPSRTEPTYREWHHWLIVNIPMNDLTRGDTLSEYVGSGPPEKTGLHRYVFLIYKQPNKIVDPSHGRLTNTSGDKRGGFRVAEFARKHGMSPTPIAGNFYQAEWDSYVPQLYKQLGM